jgi:DNA-binding GntR family transcriptional regulator
MDQPVGATKPLKIPVYRQIEQHIRDLINSPGYGPGDRVPSERVLAERLGANRMTVRKAIDGLVAQGMLERNSTSGTRIRRHRVTRPTDARPSLGITRLIQSSGGTPGNKLMHFQEQRASGRIAERLGLKEHTPITVVRRLWTIDGVPFCIETSHLPTERVPDLAAEDLIAGQSLYALLRTRYGITTIAAGERVISIATCTEMESRLLDLPPNSPCLLLRLVASDPKGQPIEYMTSVNHPRLVVFQTDDICISSS